MDIAEFAKRVQPRAKRSRLEPFRTQILTLKSMGYIDAQIRDWLALNGLEISRQAIQQFIRKHSSEALTAAPQAPTPGAIPAPVPPPEKPGQARKISTPTDLRRARNREVDLNDYSDPEGS